MLDAEIISQVMLWAVVLLLVAGYLGMPGPGKRKKALDLQNHGLPLRERLPSLDVRSIHDRPLMDEIDPSKPSVLLFTSAACQSCNGLYPILSDYADRQGVNFILFIDGEREAIDRKIMEYDIRVPVYPTDEETLSRSKITLFPFAYYLSRSGNVCAKGGIPHPDDLDLLFFEGFHAETMLPTAG